MHVIDFTLTCIFFKIFIHQITFFKSKLFKIIIKSKYTKLYYQEIRPLGSNVLQSFCVPVYYLSNLHKKFQVISAYQTNVEYEIWSSWHNLLLNYLYNSLTHIPTTKILKLGDLKTFKFIKFLILNIWPENNSLCTIHYG